jgi:flagellar biosynthetic protein FliQ
VSNESLLDLWHGALTAVATVAAPFLITCMAIGLLVAIIQTATQLQESALTFVPKLAATLVVIALGGHWMLDRMGHYMAVSFQASTQAPAIETGMSEPDQTLP